MPKAFVTFILILLLAVPLGGCITQPPVVPEVEAAATPTHAPLSLFLPFEGALRLRVVPTGEDNTINVSMQSTLRDSGLALVSTTEANESSKTFILLSPIMPAGTVRTPYYSTVSEYRSSPGGGHMSLHFNEAVWNYTFVLTLAAADSTGNAPANLWINGTGITLLGEPEHYNAKAYGPTAWKGGTELTASLGSNRGIHAQQDARLDWSTEHGTLAAVSTLDFNPFLTEARFDRLTIANANESWEVERIGAPFGNTFHIPGRPDNVSINPDGLWIESDEREWNVQVHARAAAMPLYPFVIVADIPPYRAGTVII